MADLSNLTARSPLDGVVPEASGGGEAGVCLAERRFLGKLILRGDGGDAAFRKAAESVLGCQTPSAPNTVASSNKASVVWLSPEEWMVVTAAGAEADTADALRAALDGQHAAVTDVTDNIVTIRLSGTNARQVLAKGCSIDFHPSVFAPGQCVQSHLVKAVVTIQQVDETPSYDIHVRRSFAEYLWRWLEDAGLEYGVGYEGR